MSRFFKTVFSLSIFLLAAGGIFSSAGKTDAPEAINVTNERQVLDNGQEKLKEKLRFSHLLSSEVKTIVLDAGHGGKDRGCKGGHNTKEKEIALAITLKLGRFIEDYFPDMKVIYTRKEDVFVPLSKRAKIANDSKADLFISIHCNYVRNKPNVGGSETYVMGLHTADHNLNVAMRENSSITLEDDFGSEYEGYDPNSVESHILLSMYQNAYLERSILFAELVEQQIPKVSEGRHRSRGVRQAGFLVLKATAMPSVLVESGYLSNESDEAYLRTDKGQRQVAFSIFNALSIYKNVIEKDEADVIITSNPISQPSSSLDDQTPDVDDAQEDVVLKAKTIAEKPPIVNASISYKVQLVATPIPVDMKLPRFAKLADRIEVVEADGLLKYLVPAGSERSTAYDVLSEIRENGFPKAFLGKYKGEERLQIIY